MEGPISTAFRRQLIKNLEILKDQAHLALRQRAEHFRGVQSQFPSQLHALQAIVEASHPPAKLSYKAAGTRRSNSRILAHDRKALLNRRVIIRIDKTKFQSLENLAKIVAAAEEPHLSLQTNLASLVTR